MRNTRHALPAALAATLIATAAAGGGCAPDRETASTAVPPAPSTAAGTGSSPEDAAPAATDAPAPPPDGLPDLTGLAEGQLRSPRADQTRGAEAMRDGRYAEAVAIFREGLAETPDDAALRQQLGSALTVTGDTRGAGEQFEAALRLDPANAGAYAGLAVLLSMSGRHAEAIERYAAAVQRQPDYLDARLGLIDSLRATGRLDEALAELDRAVEIEPGFAELWLARGLLLVQLGRYREARDRLDQALVVHRDHPGLTGLLIRVLAAAPDDGVRDDRRAMALAGLLLRAPPSPRIDETVAMALAEAGRYAEAAERQRRAIAGVEQAGRPDVARMMSTTLALYEQGRPSRAPLGGPAR